MSDIESWLRLIAECLVLDDSSDLPIIVILGQKGMGKSAVLDVIAESVRKSPSSPVVRLSMADSPSKPVEACLDVVVRGFRMRLPLTV